MNLIILLSIFIFLMNAYHAHCVYQEYKIKNSKESYYCKDGSCYTSMAINFESDDQKGVYPPVPKQREIRDDPEAVPFPDWEPCQCSGLYTQISYS